MLYKEIDKLIEKIETIDPVKDCSHFLESMTESNAKAIEKIFTSSHGDKEKAEHLMLLSSGCISRLIVPLPDIIKKLLKVVKDHEVSPHIRCTLIGALAYFVQPNDLIPDDAKGGYGFVDDSVLIHAAFSELLYIKGENDDLDQWKNLSELAAGVCPPNILKPLSSAVKDITVGFEVFAKMPPGILEAKIRQVILDPFQPVVYKPAPEETNQAVNNWSPYVNVNNAKNISFEFSKGNFAANFVDGSRIIVK